MELDVAMVDEPRERKEDDMELESENLHRHYPFKPVQLWTKEVVLTIYQKELKTYFLGGARFQIPSTYIPESSIGSGTNSICIKLLTISKKGAFGVVMYNYFTWFK